jgi:hypothetical protein
MIGKTLRFRQCPYECCGLEREKHTVKIREKAEAFKYEELATEEHPDGLCSNEKTGMAGCDYCYGDDYDGNGPEDLEGIEGVTFGER